MTELTTLIDLSTYLGERFDLVQAGGGNTSVKLDNNSMLIKSSGSSLSEMDINYGYTTVEVSKIVGIIENFQKNKETKNKIEDFITQISPNQDIKPSIEVFLHAILKKYTLHIHPLTVNIIVSRQDWEEILFSLFDANKIITIKYRTPGIQLAVDIYNKIQELGEKNIIFLQNHGVIVTSDSKNNLLRNIENIVKKIEAFLSLDLQHYRNTNKIGILVRSVCKNNKLVCYLSEDLVLSQTLASNRELFLLPPFCPDGVVYCGFHAVEIKNLSNQQPIIKYLKENHVPPKIILFDQWLYIIAQSTKKAREIEEMLKFQVMVTKQNEDVLMNFLNNQEMHFLNNWELERFRQNRK